MAHVQESFNWKRSAIAAPCSSSAVRNLLNIGSGKELTIRELAEIVVKATCYEGAIEWDHSKPDGTPRKLLDIERLTSLGWQPSIPLEEGIRLVYEDYRRGYMNIGR